MRLNENEGHRNTAIATSKVLLVPYCEHHVETYHRWMEDEDLRLATASDQLTLSEEYAMQQSWRKDHDKLTFIICVPTETVSIKGHDSPERMIGDVNVFLYDADESNDEVNENPESPPSLVGEIELMIARKDLHRQGYGRAALLAFMEYILTKWERIAHEFCEGNQQTTQQGSTPKLAYLRARINASNERSTHLFRSIGFVQNGDGPNYFGEVELRWTQTLDDLRRLKWHEKSWQLPYS